MKQALFIAAVALSVQLQAQQDPNQQLITPRQESSAQNPTQQGQVGQQQSATQNTTIVIQGAQVNVAPARGPLPAPFVVDQRIPQHNQVQRTLDLCHEVLQTLQRAELRALWQAADQNFAAASQTLVNGLAQASSDLQTSYPYNYPYTKQAVGWSLELANAANEELKRVDAHPESPRILFLIVHKMISSVYFAYESLDNQYYPQIVKAHNDCGGCGNKFIIPYDPNDQFSINYFDNLRKLALFYLDLQSQLSPFYGSQRLEIVMSSKATQAAQSLLSQSIYREDFCPVINDLGFFQVSVCDWLDSGTDRNYQDLRRFRSYTRSSIESFRDRLGNLRGGRGCGNDQYDPIFGRRNSGIIVVPQTQR
jgi:hypothetical protein